MASSLEYIYTCQVCFEEFEETGDHVPRLLPCTHTLCETCIGQMIRQDVLECPECRQKHRATSKEKSFPQNKYILVNIKRRPTLKEEQGASKEADVDLCDKHNRRRSLFCIEADCQKLICHLCLKDEHRSHEFEEAQQMLEEKRNVLVENVELLRENLLENKEKLLIAKEDAKKNTNECTEKIAKAKDEQIKTLVQMMAKLYDKMIANVTANFADMSFNINNKTSEIDSTVSAILADINENSKKVTSVADILEMIATVNIRWEEILRCLPKIKNARHFRYNGRQRFTVQ